jgi:hypothetical protein
MPPTFISVDATIDGKKVGGESGMFVSIDDTDERTCRELLLAFLKDKGHGDASIALPEGSTIVLRCVKMNDVRLHGGRPAADVGLIQDCTVFLTYPVNLAIVEVPTKKFSFYCTRPEEARPPLSNAMVVMMTNAFSGNTHLPCARAFRKMTGKDVLYNDFRDYLKQEGVGFPHDKASSLGDDFLSNLATIIFPLSNNVWQALNDKHNRGGAAPEQEFAAFFGRRVYSKKVDRPNYGLVLRHLQEAWIGTHAIVKKGNWPVVACKLKHLLMLIEKYCMRILGQGERQAILNQREEPARTAENASNVATIEALPWSKTMHDDLRSICNDLIIKDLYCLLDANSYMEGMSKHQR